MLLRLSRVVQLYGFTVELASKVASSLGAAHSAETSVEKTGRAVSVSIVEGELMAHSSA